MDPLQLALYKGRLGRHAPIRKMPRPAPKFVMPATIEPPKLTPGIPVPLPAPLPAPKPWPKWHFLPPDEPRPITLKRIVRVVAAEFEVTVEQIRGHYRTRKFTFPRHIAQYLAQRVLKNRNISLPIIGRYFFRDHTSVLHGIRKIARRVNEDPAAREIVQRLERKLRGADIS